jgi:hypothetical protein
MASGRERILRSDRQKCGGAARNRISGKCPKRVYINSPWNRPFAPHMTFRPFPFDPFQPWICSGTGGAAVLSDGQAEGDCARALGGPGGGFPPVRGAGGGYPSLFRYFSEVKLRVAPHYFRRSLMGIRSLPVERSPLGDSAVTGPVRAGGRDRRDWFPGAQGIRASLALPGSETYRKGSRLANSATRKSDCYPPPRKGKTARVSPGASSVSSPQRDWM